MPVEDLGALPGGPGEPAGVPGDPDPQAVGPVRAGCAHNARKAHPERPAAAVAGPAADRADTTTIAVVGASANPDRAGYEVYSYLVGTGDYRVYPVNPTITEIDGAPTYPSLADLPEPVDLVDVFRRSSELPAVLADAGNAGAPQDPVAAAGDSPIRTWPTGRGGGITVVMDCCLKVDHQRYR